MVVFIVQISFITGLTSLFLYLNRENRSGLNTTLITCCFLMCLLIPLINKLPIDLPSITINNKWKEVIIDTPEWQKNDHEMTPLISPNTLIDLSANNSSSSVKLDFVDTIEILLLYIWIAGMLVQFIGKYAQYKKLKKIVLCGKPLNSVKSTLTVLTSEHTDVPFLFVNKKSYIVIPELVRHWDMKHKVNIIAHEQCHYQRKDHWHLILASFVNTIYWFHPLVKYLSERQNSEIETACDEQLIKSGIDRVSYAETLLAFVNNTHKNSGYASMATKPKLVQLRIKSVLNRPEKTINHSKKPYVALISVILMSLGCTDLKQMNWVPSTGMITFIDHDLPTMRENELERNQVLISAFYDGKVNEQTYIHLEIQNTENEASWLPLGPLRKFNEYIHTWHFELKGTSHFTGRYKVIGAQNDGIIDGVAMGMLTVDSTGDIELLKTKSKLSNVHTPNIVCAWPLGISEAEFLRVLPQLTYNSPDAVERILCGSQLVQNGEHQLN